MGSLMGTWIRSSTRTLMGNGERGYEAQAMSREGLGGGGGGRGLWGVDREKGYKKGIIIFLFTRAMPGTPASKY